MTTRSAHGESNALVMFRTELLDAFVGRIACGSVKLAACAGTYASAADDHARHTHTALMIQGSIVEAEAGAPWWRRCPGAGQDPAAALGRTLDPRLPFA
jgi:hypothetical protein